MSQVIEVRFINPANNEKVYDGFTKVVSREDPHKEAIDLAMAAWSGGIGEIKGIQREGEGTFVKSPAPCWRYLYTCIIEDDEFDRTMIAILFAEYQV